MTVSPMANRTPRSVSTRLRTAVTIKKYVSKRNVSQPTRGTGSEGEPVPVAHDRVFYYHVSRRYRVSPTGCIDTRIHRKHVVADIYCHVVNMCV